MGTKPYLILEEKFKDLTFTNEDIVLEIGSERGDGSSVFLHNWALERGLKFISIDVTSAASSYNPALIDYRVVDSGSNWCRNVLPTLNKKIKVLYLDNFDIIWPCSYVNGKPDIPTQQLIQEYAAQGVTLNNDNCKLEHKLQTQYCLPYMQEQSIFIYDDTFKNFYNRPDINWEGKGGTAVPLLIKAGYSTTGHTISQGEYLDVVAYRGCNP